MRRFLFKFLIIKIASLELKSCASQSLMEESICWGVYMEGKKDMITKYPYLFIPSNDDDEV